MPCHTDKAKPPSRRTEAAVDPFARKNEPYFQIVTLLMVPAPTGREKRRTTLLCATMQLPSRMPKADGTFPRYKRQVDVRATGA